MWTGGAVQAGGEGLRADEAVHSPPKTLNAWYTTKLVKINPEDTSFLKVKTSLAQFSAMSRDSRKSCQGLVLLKCVLAWIEPDRKVEWPDYDP